MKSNSPEEWGKIYEEKFKYFDGYTEKLRALIEDLLIKEDIDSHIESRTKSSESFVLKIHRKKNKYQNPLEEITDLTGIRIISYHKDDEDNICDIIKNEFDIDPEKSIDKIDFLDPDRFGYQSIQYIITLKDNRKLLTEWQIYKEFKAEIQIRTILQHAWAYIDTILGWKTRDETPKDLQRKLFRLSALFEIADDEFSNLLKLKAKANESYIKDLKSGELDIELNMSSLESYFETTKKNFQWSKIAAEIGYAPIKAHLKSYNWLRQEIEHRRILSNLLPLIGIRTTRDLDEVFQNAEEWGKDVLRKILINSEKFSFTPFANPYEIVIILCFYDKREQLSDEILNKANFVEPFKLAMIIVTTNK